MVGKAAAEERRGEGKAARGRAGQGEAERGVSRGRILTRWMGWERNGEWDEAQVQRGRR